MLSPEDYQEALRCYKDKKLNGHERQRYHALLLVTKGGCISKYWQERER